MNGVAVVRPQAEVYSRFAAIDLCAYFVIIYSVLLCLPLLHQALVPTFAIGYYFKPCYSYFTV